jgi:hypothetical protein
MGSAEKTIKFKHRADNSFVPPIVPASKALPDWYKSMSSRQEGQKEWDAPGVKACMPFFDALIQGYIIPLWADLYVSTHHTEDGTPHPAFTWGPAGDPIINSHDPNQTEGIPMMKNALGGGPAYKFDSPWVIETPKDYSTLFVTPLNNAHPFFQVVSAIVSTDNYANVINFPFIWTGPEDWEGVLPQGTPIVQAIPFKRDDFNHEIRVMTEAEIKSQHSITRALGNSFQGAYKNLFRKTSKSR